MTSAALVAAPAQAATGYDLDASTAEVSLAGQALPHGIAVDQTSRRIYIAIVAADAFNATPGEVTRFESDLSAAGTFAAEGDTYYAGVAVDPTTQKIYAAQEQLETSKGNVGTSQMDLFSSAGSLESSFALGANGTLPHIGTDSGGNVFYPSAANESVQVFNSSGALEEEIDCEGCTGGTFVEPVSVALNSEDDLYVVDLATDRVVKLGLSGGEYAFESVLQSGRGAAAVAVDPGTDDVLVGDLPGGKGYHIVAYDLSGAEFDDFGAGLFTDPEPQFGGPRLATQIAADATSHRLYVGEVGKFYVFERTTIPPPSVTPEAPNPVGQIEATLKTRVNANGHAVLECEFEYTDNADFEVNGFNNATTVACPENPVGLDDTALSLNLQGLAPTTKYHYRVTASSHAGTVSGSPEDFETLPVVLPTVTTEPAAEVGEASATLQAKVNPHGGSVSDCHFEFGTSTAYGTNLSCTVLPGAVSTDLSQSRGVSGLDPATTYHYRLVVTSNAGAVEGEDVAFKTDDPPPEPDDSDPDDSSAAPLPILLPPPVVLQPPVQRRPRCRKGFRLKRVRGKVRCVRRCRRGFRQRRVRGKIRCLNKCRRGFRKKRVLRKSGGRRRVVVRCVRKRKAAAPRRSNRRQAP